MVITVQFKDKDMNFKGRTYDFQLETSFPPPKEGDIIRMMNEDGTKYVCNGTRVKVIDVKKESKVLQPQIITYLTSDLNEPSFSMR